MPRYAFKVEYHGAGYAGWQRQSHCKTVQGEIETALAQLEPDVPSIAAAGRTDAGVHALAQVAQADMAKDWLPERLMGALNYHLKGSGIAIVACASMEPNWHARFSAVERRYLFRLVYRRAPLTHDDGLVWQVRHPLDTDAMQAGANYLIGHHDFTTFRSTMCQAASPVKSLDQLDITQHDYPQGAEYRFHLRARSFLHNQVRSFVGTLERVGAGAWAPQDVKTALDACNRQKCGPVCPPQGLYLSGVTYPADPFGE